ncbi:hypothetical protein KP509_16G011400 [Ceratopteris richardii]|uniref:PsbP C-terminal domain-containing protein n=1 Tax=Ceratopteris richardii TaxID=49495 RepID=A0A8T2SZN8_CERRI|nr:hypothetical protein KP509_16G011400 [Ceratopteris richardii]
MSGAAPMAASFASSLTNANAILPSIPISGPKCGCPAPLFRHRSPATPPRVLSSIFDQEKQAVVTLHAGSGITRRDLLGHILFSVFAVPSLPALAADEKSDFIQEFSTYNNDDDNYSLLVPAGWVQGNGKAVGERLVTAFYPANDTSVNVNVLITPVGPDYTSLGSFGTVDAFAETLVNSLDRSWKKPPGQAAKLIDSKSKKGFYYIEYTIQQPGEKKRHLLSVVGMRFNGWYNRLYTVTGQYFQEDESKYGAVLGKVVDSFKFV